jgi:hypothetical protein
VTRSIGYDWEPWKGTLETTEALPAADDDDDDDRNTGGTNPWAV